MLHRLASLLVVMFIASPLAAAPADDTTPANDAAQAKLGALAREAQRPRALPVLYGTFTTLQVMDIATTRRAIGVAGAREANLAMGSGNTAQLIAMKAASTAISIYLAEKTWKKNRVAAIVTMVAVNGMTAAVVAHNAQIRR
jgi:ribosomal protein L2